MNNKTIPIDWINFVQHKIISLNVFSFEKIWFKFKNYSSSLTILDSAETKETLKTHILIKTEEFNLISNVIYRIIPCLFLQLKSADSNLIFVFLLVFLVKLRVERYSAVFYVRQCWAREISIFMFVFSKFRLSLPFPQNLAWKLYQTLREKNVTVPEHQFMNIYLNTFGLIKFIFRI